jgi:hypothetical protein
MEYGVAGGVAMPFSPSDELGGAAGISAVTDGALTGGSSLLRARGEILGLLMRDSKAAMPTLSGDVGVRLGRVDLFLSGGVQLFGVAHRSDHTVFATFGLTGGLGLSVRVSSDLRLTCRSVAAWLPSFSTGIMNDPPAGVGKPTFAFLSILIGVAFQGPDSGDNRFE